MIVIGVDPGLHGAIGFISHKEYWVVDMPTLKIMVGRKRNKKTGKMVDRFKMEYADAVFADIMREYNGRNARVYIEKVHSMPGQGVRSMESIGQGMMLPKAICAAFKIPYTLVTPQAWKKVMLAGMGKEKDASIYRAQQLFPNVEFVGPRGGKYDGRAEALLIAEYGRLLEQ